MKSKEVKKLNTYELFRQNIHSSQYPLELINIILSGNSQFQTERATYLLSQWSRSYQTMSEFNRNRYNVIMPKLLNKMVLVLKKDIKLDTTIIIMYSIYNFEWKLMTEAIVQGLNAFKPNILELVWQMTIFGIQNPKQESNIMILEIISKNFQQPLRKYQFKQNIQIKYLLQIAQIVNIPHSKKEFLNNGDQWVKIMRKALQEKKQVDKHNFLTIIISTRSLLVQISTQFLKQSISMFVKVFQQSITQLNSKTQFNLKIIKCFKKILIYPQTKEILQLNRQRYIFTLLEKITKQTQHNPNSMLNLPQYICIKQLIYDIFWRDNSQQQKLIINNLIKLFTEKATSSEFQQQLANQISLLLTHDFFVDNLTVQKIISVITTVHLRRKMPIDCYTYLFNILYCVASSSINKNQFNPIIKNAIACCVIKLSLLDPKKSILYQAAARLIRRLVELMKTQEVEKNSKILYDWIQSYEINQSLVSLDNLIILDIISTAECIMKNQKIVDKIVGHVSLKLSQQLTTQKIYYFTSTLLKLNAANSSICNASYQISTICPQSNNELKITLYRTQALLMLFFQNINKNKQKIQKIFENLLNKNQIWENQYFLNLSICIVQVFIIKYIQCFSLFEFIVKYDQRLLFLLTMLVEKQSISLHLFFLLKYFHLLKIFRIQAYLSHTNILKITHL